MSLEQALQENTEAITRLIAAINGAGIATCAQEVPDTKKPVSTQPAATKAVKAETAAASPSELKYADIQKPFLKLVNANRDKAVALLAELGVPSLKAIEGKPELFADVLAKIQKAGA